QGEVEGGPLSRRPFGPHPPAVAVEDPLHRRQADAVALELVGPVQPLERLEQLVGVGRVEPDPVVAHEVRDLPLVPDGPERDAGARLFAGVLPDVAQQVLPNDSKQISVAIYYQIGLIFEFYSPMPA